MKMYKLHCSLLFVTLFFTIYSSIANNNSHAIILAGKESRGRLGDNILLYCKAKYFSFKYGIPLVYKNYPYFEQLTLSKYEALYTPQIGMLYSPKTLISDSQDIKNLFKSSALLEINYFCNMRKHHDPSEPYVGCGEFPFDWIKKKMIKYPAFGAELKRNLQILDEYIPSKPLAKDCITVAVSTRLGSGDDTPYLFSEQFFSREGLLEDQEKQHSLYLLPADKGNPFKFIPQQFYIDQVKRLSNLLLHRNMYIYLFIDKEKDFVDKIVTKWREALADYKNIVIECNIEKTYDKRIFDDLYYMSKCDCLIRGCSHFSGIAQLAGDHKIIIGPDPVSFYWADPKHLIFQKTFIYFQNTKQNKFEQYVYEDTDNCNLIAIANKFIQTIEEKTYH